MKRLALALLLLAAPAQATSYYVSASGDSTNAGTSCAAAKTLAWANINTRAGDVCYLCDGVYNTRLQPGNTGTNGSRISFIGNIAHPENVSVPGVQIDSTSAPIGGLRCGGFVSVKGVHSRTNIDMKAYGPYDHTDSVLYCTTAQGFNLSGRGKATVRYCTLGDSANYDDQMSIGYNPAGGRTEKGHYVSDISFIDNTVYVNTTPGGTGPNAFSMQNVRNSTFSRNRVHFYIVPTSAGKSGMTWYQTQSMTVADNYFGGISDGSETNGQSYLASFRDNQRFNVFERDTFMEERANGTTAGLTPLKVGIEISGMPVNGTTDLGDRNVEWHNCFVKVRGLIEMEAPYPAYTFRNNVFVTGNNMRLGNSSSGYTDSLEFRHNTVALFSPTTGFSGHALRSSRIAQNIFFSGVDRTNGALVVYNDGISTALGGLYCGTTAGFADSNLVCSATQSDSVDAFTSCSRGGSNEALPSVWCSTTGQDCNSVWATPAFTDSNFWSFNPIPDADGRAVSAGFADGYAGAIDPRGGDSTDPTLSVDWPASAKTYTLGSYLNIGWTCSDNVGITNVKVFYAESADGPWRLATTQGATSPTVYRFRIPVNISTPEMFVRVVAYDAAGNSKSLTQNFSVIPSGEENGPRLDTP